MSSVLIVSRFFYPAFKAGGPARSTTNLVELISKESDIDVICSSMDLGSSNHMHGIKVDQWQKILDSSVFYASVIRLAKGFCKSIGFKPSYDYVYLNSFFDFNYTVKFLIFILLGSIRADSLILAPRGELSDGAMSLKRKKKLLYLAIFKRCGLKEKICFHFTSELEANESLRYLGNVNYKIIPNMHGKVPDYKDKEKNKGELDLVFISRISPKKNLLTAINALRGLSAGIINFKIVGQIDDESYWSKCKALLDELPKNVKVSFLGSRSQEEVHDILASSHAFILPTLNENFGHAIVESMIYSNIPLLSNNTPWSAVGKNGGYISLDHFDSLIFQDQISEILNLDYHQYNEKTYKVYSYILENLESNQGKIHEMFL